MHDDELRDSWRQTTVSSCWLCLTLSLGQCWSSRAVNIRLCSWTKSSTVWLPRAVRSLQSSEAAWSDVKASVDSRCHSAGHLKVLADILLALDSGNLVMLTLLDLSAAFDSVDHNTLLCRLRTSYGLRDACFDWFKSYLSGRTQYVRSTSTSSKPSEVQYGVPQGSVLGPILFLLYTADCCS